MNCPLCENHLTIQKNEKYFLCEVCSGIAMHEDFYPSTEIEKARYEEHNNDVEDERYQLFTKPIWSYVLSNFNKQHLGLDFGSGTGPVISDILMKNGFNVAQYDPFFCPDKQALQRKYNYIMACEVIEHFINPALEFEKLHNMLLPSGELLCMTHIYDESINFIKWYYKSDPTHVFIYQKETFEWIKARFDFADLQVDGRLVKLRF